MLSFRKESPILSIHNFYPLLLSQIMRKEISFFKITNLIMYLYHTFIRLVNFNKERDRDAFFKDSLSYAFFPLHTLNCFHKYSSMLIQNEEYHLLNERKFQYYLIYTLL